MTDESLVLTVAVASFIARFLLADWNSYWQDELLSVLVYGVWHDSVVEAVRVLGEVSVHPPLYQATLYIWMDIFGTSEVATRSLSNLYISGATVALYFMLRIGLSRQLALMSAVTFAVLSSPTYYALETRSYAQTMFLVTVSSYLLMNLLVRRRDDEQSGNGWLVAGVVLINSGVLLTHYYNVFFLAAQAVVALVYAAVIAHPGGRLRRLRSLLLVLAAPLLLFTAVWGSRLMATFGRVADEFAVDEGDGVRGPFGLLWESVLSPNIRPPLLIGLAGVVLLLTLVSKATWTAWAGRKSTTTPPLEAWIVIYLVSWLVLPFVMAYIGFSLTGVARYNVRYFLFAVPPLAPLFVMSIAEGARIVSSATRLVNVKGALLAVAWVALVVALVIPGTLGAATTRKHDWRGTVAQVVDLINADPQSSYIVYETSFRNRSMADFYFERMSSTLRVHGSILRSEERRGEYAVFEPESEAVIREHDYLVVIFTHSRTTHYPNALSILEDRYSVRHRQLNALGRGFIVYAVGGQE